MYVCFSIQEFFIFSKTQKITSEMSIIIFQETAPLFLLHIGFDILKKKESRSS